LTVPEIQPKYVFSNDKFYDPILYFCGWHRLSLLENGIGLGKTINIHSQRISAKDEVPYLKLMWGAVYLFLCHVYSKVSFFKALK
jgi:hypothetical protein